MLTRHLPPVQVWAPPTPPRDDSDVYLDPMDDLLYEDTPMTEAQLPPVFVRKEPRRHIKTEPGVALREYLDTQTGPCVTDRYLRQMVSVVHQLSSTWDCYACHAHVLL